MVWRDVILVAAGVLLVAGVLVKLWRPGSEAGLRERGADLARLPGRLRRIAADPRTPRRARWLLVGLAVYLVSPIDIIPDFIPVLGHADEVVLVPLALRWVRRMVPPEVWDAHFPARGGREERVIPEVGERAEGQAWLADGSRRE